MASGLNDEWVIHKKTQQHICGCTKEQGVGTMHNRLLDKPCLKSFLLWHWHNRQTYVLNHIIGNQYTYCFTDTEGCTVWGWDAVYFDKINVLYSWTVTQSRSRNLPCHWDKDRNGVRLVPLKLFLSFWAGRCLHLPCCPAIPSPRSPGSDSGALYLKREG